MARVSSRQSAGLSPDDVTDAGVPRSTESGPFRGRSGGRRGGVRLGLAALLVVVAALLIDACTGAPVEDSWTPTPAGELAHAEDALHREVLRQLRVFTDWLDENEVDGYIGEVGWPAEEDTERWNRLAEVWLAEAEAADLWVTTWSAGEWWGDDYPLSPFVVSGDGGPVDSSRVSGELLAWHAEQRHLTLGVNTSGAEFGAPGGTEETSTFSNLNPGTHGRDYHYDGQATFDYLGSRGLDVVRLPFRWERVQPELGGDLDAEELARLTAAVSRAHAAGLGVILDLHNYGAYFLDDGTQGVRRPVGSAEVTREYFVDFWRRLSEAVHDEPGVVAYGLMNEPVGLPAADGESAAQAWEQASQEAVETIRSAGDRTTVMVAGYEWSHVWHWSEVHPKAWIQDPADNIRYEAHHYWQQAYERTYDVELAEAAAAEAAASPADATAPEVPQR
jgi:hypothetical protein